MSKAVAQRYLVAITELMVEPRGCQVKTGVKGKESAIAFKLIYDVGVSGSLPAGGTMGLGFGFTVNKPPNTAAHCAAGRKVGGSAPAALVMHGTLAAPSPASPCRIDTWLFAASPSGWKMLVFVRIGTAVCAFARSPSNELKKKVLSFCDREPNGTAELLAGQCVFNVRALYIRRSGIECLAWRESLADGEWVGGIERVIRGRNQRASHEHYWCRFLLRC